MILIKQDTYFIVENVLSIQIFLAVLHHDVGQILVYKL